MTSRPRRLVLHVGPPKTATTFLQTVAVQQREALLEQGFLYPLVNGTHYLASLEMRGDIGHGYERTKAIGKWQRFVDEASDFDGTVVMSSEMLCRGDTAAILESARMLGDDIEIDVVITARDPARLSVSAWQNHVRDTMVLPFRAEFCQDLRFPDDEDGPVWGGSALDEFIARWSAAVGPDHVTVVTNPQSGGDPMLLWRRFCEAVGVDHERLPEPDRPTANESLGPAQVEAMRRLNVTLDGRMNRKAYVDDLKVVMVRRVLPQTAGNDQRGHLPAELMPIVDRTTDRWLRAIEHHGVRVVGDVDELRSARPGTPAVDDVDEDDVLRVLVQALAELVASDDVLKRKVKKRSGESKLWPQGARKRHRRRARRQVARGDQLVARLDDILAGRPPRDIVEVEDSPDDVDDVDDLDEVDGTAEVVDEPTQQPATAG